MTGYIQTSCATLFSQRGNKPGLLSFTHRLPGINAPLKGRALSGMMMDMNTYRVLVGSLVLFFAMAGSGTAFGENWVLFNKSPDGTLWYYDSDSIVSMEEGDIKRVWDKSVRTEEWKKRLQEASDKYGKDIDAMSIDHTLTLDDFHCTMKKHRFVKVIDSSKDGREIYSQELKGSRWRPIPPRSIIESLFGIVCKD